MDKYGQHTKYKIDKITGILWETETDFSFFTEL